MRNDANNNRKGAFIARLRDYKECYLKGLWVGLMATPEEIVHDASGEKPRLTLTKLVKRVGTEIFHEESKVSARCLTQRNTKFEAMDILNERDIPCGPILSMEEIMADESLRKTGTIVEVDHPTRGKYLTVGNPIKMSDSPTDVTRSPLLGEHTAEVLAELGYSKDDVKTLREGGVI